MYKVFHVLTTNWRPSKVAVEELAGYVADNVRMEKPDAIVFQLLDNVLFQGRRFDGSTSLQSKGSDGQFHVEGELILAPKATQLNIFNLLKPVMAASGEGLITPALLMLSLKRKDRKFRRTSSTPSSMALT